MHGHQNIKELNIKNLSLFVSKSLSRSFWSRK